MARVKSEGLSRGFGSSFQINVGDENGEGGGDNNTNANNNNTTTTTVEATDTEQVEFANASAATLAVFDSACQTLMYVLCYRMDDIVRHGGEPAETLRSMPLRQILYSRLQPLHTCVSEVVIEFLVRAAAAGMEGFDQALIERHKREDKERKDRPDGGGAGERFHRRGRRRASLLSRDRAPDRTTASAYVARSRWRRSGGRWRRL